MTELPLQPESIMIREFRSADTARVTSIWEQVFPDDRPHNQPAKVIRDKISVQDNLFFVAEEERRVTGTVLAGYDGHRGWLYTIAVDPTAHRTGTGKKLVERALEALKARGCTKVNLQIRTDNSQVVQFYERLGFKLEERISMGKLL
jgi:ribosomal protein S18 acetylase RimI-like enzyme